VTTHGEPSNREGYTRGMHRPGRSIAVLAAAAFAAAVHAAPSAELLDLAGRVHYGFYHAEPAAIETALAGLERLAESREVTYYRDFAALRRAQLGGADRAGRERLKACASRDIALSGDKRVAAEGWVLVAACADVGGDDNRRTQALARARALDADNPRIALVEAWALRRAAGADAARRAEAERRLAQAADAFDAWTPSLDDPDWGHAEALTALAALALERGEARRARDLIERALLLAPGYRTALDLQTALQGARASSPAP
jgi:tetratricopeptide (TPR) repeat protein